MISTLRDLLLLLEGLELLPPDESDSDPSGSPGPLDTGGADSLTLAGVLLGSDVRRWRWVVMW